MNWIASQVGYLFLIVRGFNARRRAHRNLARWVRAQIAARPPIARAA
jgi:hypothetical protein